MGTPRTGQPGEVKVHEESYTATIKVRRRRVQSKANANGYFDDPMQEVAGVMMEMEVSSLTLEGIQLKVKQHIDLLSNE